MFNLKRYLGIFKLFLRAKIVFKNPQQHELVIFDDVSILDFENLLHHYDFFILKSRIKNIDKIYFSFTILGNFFRNYRGNIMTAYFVSLLEIIRPKVVLTNIDNSLKFSETIIIKKSIIPKYTNNAEKLIKDWLTDCPLLKIQY